MSQEHQHDFEQVIGHLRSKGVRITETRKAIVTYIKKVMIIQVLK